MDYDFVTRLILAILTCYRLARMIAEDDGPLFLFKRMRYWAKDKAWFRAIDAKKAQIDDAGNVDFDPRYFGGWHNLSEGLSCPYCVGVWLSLPIFTFVLWPNYYADMFLILMAISGGQAFLQSLGRD